MVDADAALIDRAQAFAAKLTSIPRVQAWLVSDDTQGMHPLGRIVPTRRPGTEVLHADGTPVGGTLSEFWQWSASDLISNATRGHLAEYLVFRAVGCSEACIRNEWDAFDLTTPDGVRVEVKIFWVYSELA